ncbi:biotin/lipoyl-binding protein [Fulvivirga sp. M361]|uniref:biotin/lipoyl-containing protein n=1 Tax=Fulvivirga sp. M361 TaxID=2594266 RepID=UPI00117B7078|nr:acetyl-CoA carboxylase biotin carboxyl carrier protein subunit [Fulvivirga sp. M361]TRX59415.1 biotin/lipoyl-binding protein [Fulvivirga sp. M361]
MAKNYKFTINGNEYTVDIQSFEGNLVELEVNGTPYTVALAEDVKTPKTPKLVRAKTPKTNTVKPLTSSAGLSKITAPLPGVVIEVKVKEGDTVKTDETLLTMEAMKMENNVLAEKDGIVKSIKVNPGDNILQGDLLIEIE